MAWASRVLPLQKLARTIDYWSKAISHVRGTRRFGPFWSRHYMELYLGKRMARRVRCCVKGMAHVEIHQLSCCRLLIRYEICLRCSGDRLQMCMACIFQRV